MSADITYAPDRIGYRYRVPDPAYSKGYHRGQDVRERGRRGSIITDVDAIDDGRVVYVGRPNDLLGLTVVIDTGRDQGRYESHSHMAGVVVSVGQQVESGQRLGRNAAMDENPGKVDGVHDHITITDAYNGAWMTWMDEYDPLPFIQAAYARAVDGSTAAGGGTPWQPPVKEWDEMASEQQVETIVQRAVGAALARAAAPGGRTVHFRTEGDEWTLGDPALGHDLAPFTGTADDTTRRDLGDGVYLFRGFMVTADPTIGTAWARIYTKGVGGETSRTDRASYIAIQRELSRVATLTEETA